MHKIQHCCCCLKKRVACNPDKTKPRRLAFSDNAAPPHRQLAGTPLRPLHGHVELRVGPKPRRGIISPRIIPSSGTPQIWREPCRPGLFPHHLRVVFAGGTGTGTVVDRAVGVGVDVDVDICYDLGLAGRGRGQSEDARVDDGRDLRVTWATRGGGYRERKNEGGGVIFYEFSEKMKKKSNRS